MNESEDKLNEAKVQTRVKYIAMAFLSKSDQNRFDKLLEHLENQHTQGYSGEITSLRHTVSSTIEDMNQKLHEDNVNRTQQQHIFQHRTKEEAAVTGEEDDKEVEEAKKQSRRP